MDLLALADFTLVARHGGFGKAARAARTGETFDIPCCDVFHLRDGKVVSFHCYNEFPAWLSSLPAN